MEQEATGDSHGLAGHGGQVGIPPVGHAVALLGGLFLHLRVRRLRLFRRRRTGWAAGAALIGAGVLVMRWSFNAMSRAGENPDPHIASSGVVSDGPFGFSRNPIYLGLSLVEVGVACVMNVLWPVLLLPGALLFLDRVVVPREERYLDEELGEPYRAYRGRVRRWL